MNFPFRSSVREERFSHPSSVNELTGCGIVRILLRNASCFSPLIATISHIGAGDGNCSQVTNEMSYKIGCPMLPFGIDGSEVI